MKVNWRLAEILLHMHESYTTSVTCRDLLEYFDVLQTQASINGTASFQKWIAHFGLNCLRSAWLSEHVNFKPLGRRMPKM